MEIACGIFIIDKNGNVLICCPRGTKDKHNWTIPKGKVEKDETFIDAAIRETLEETGLDLKPFKTKIKEIGQRKYKHKKKKLIGFVLYLDGIIDCETLSCVNGEHPEITHYELVSIKEATKRLHDVQSDLLKEFIKDT